HARADRIETARLPLHRAIAAVRPDASASEVPLEKYRWMSSSTSARSPFWLTDRLGLTSHPANKVGRGEIETVKHPSPSTYPEMYDPRSTWPCQEPASCPSHRFAMPRRYVAAVTGPGAY